MDPRITEIYGQDPHSVTWWIVFLTIAVVLTFILVGIFLIGVTKAYEGTDEVAAPAPEPVPLDRADDTAPEPLDSDRATSLTGVA